MSDGELEAVFNSFCAFGAGTKGGPAMMDNSKFNKLFKDLKLYTKSFTSTDTDIIFNRTEVKAKTERKITFQQFKKALELCAEKRKGNYDDLVAKICSGKGPGTTGATSTSSLSRNFKEGISPLVSKTVKAGGVDRLTDTSKYTGSHKERFDETGKGKGLEGRKDFDEKAASGYVGGYKGKDSYDKTH